MNTVMKHLILIERIDQLIRLRATGTPQNLAKRLGVSKTKLYRMISMMKDMNAPVEYDEKLGSYIYEEAVGFSFGFHAWSDRKNIHEKAS